MLIITALAAIVGVSVGSCITWKIFTRERIDKYRFASLDAKIKAHQEAFDLCWDLPESAHNSEKDDSHLRSCQEWYRKNCLYLEPEARKAFDNAYQNAWNYKLYLEKWRKTDNAEPLKTKWDEIISAIKIIESNIGKPLIASEIQQHEYDFKGKTIKS